MNSSVYPTEKLLPFKPDRNKAKVQVSFHQVSKSYLCSKDEAIQAIKQLNLEIFQGEIFGIIGRSGAGKSTLIRTINRLEPITSGTLLVDDQDISQFSDAELVQFRRRIGMIFQHFNLLSSKTVLENLALPLQAAGKRPFEIEIKAKELLHLVGLEDKANMYPSSLSGGQKQRVGIARALMLEPHILLCDEATSALDPETTQSILSLLKGINRKLGLTIILITHEMAVIRDICDRVAVLEAGELVEQGEVWRIFGAPQHEATRALLEPLQSAIPEDLQQQLSIEPGSDDQHLLARLYFDGLRHAAPDISSLTQHLGNSVRLLNANIERIQGRSQGQLLVLLPKAAGENLKQRIANFASRVEVLGYVPGNA